jgi:hypothetical protein
MRNGEFAYVDGFGHTFLPDVRVYPFERYVYRPMRGYSAILAVEDTDGSLIGWVLVTDLGHDTVKAWIKAERYLPQTEKD